MSNNSDISRITPESWLASNANKLKFVVPVYQRLFTWEDAQFDRLLADLTDWNNPTQSSKPYYLGIITIVQRETIAQREKDLLLIDGQQRLTVIALLAGLFGWSKDLKPRDFLDYEARPKDRQALEFIWGNGASWLTKERHDVENAVACIASESMRKFVLHVFDNKDKWKKLSDSVKRSLTLLMSHLPQNYSNQTELQNEYFEKMNSAGRQLEPHEILKVRICSAKDAFKVWNAAEDFTKCYAVGTGNDALDTGVTFLDVIDVNKTQIVNNKEIQIKTETQKSIGVPIKSDEQKSSIEKWRPALIDFPMFLLHVLKSYLNDDKGIASQNNIFSIPGDSHKLLEIFSMHKVDCTKFVKKMIQYRDFLDKWIIHKSVGDDTGDGGGDDSRFSYWTIDSERKAQETALFRGEATNDCEKLKQVQMALYAIDGNQKWLCDAFLKFYTVEEDQRSAGTLYSILFDKLIAIAGFAKLKEHNTTNEHQEWLFSALRYGEAKPAHFVCLDYFLWLLANSESDGDKELKSRVFGESSIPQAIVRFVPRANRSVEHFHPQTDNNNSSCHIGPTEDRCESRPGWGTDIKDTKVSIKDIFGNLALISAGRNSEYSNFSVNEKSARIRKQCASKSLESIKLWLMANSCDFDDAQWTPTKACEHAKLMLKVIKWGLGQVGPDN